MAQLFPELFAELRERLLRAGVAPRHVRRYLSELGDHFTDLRAEEESAGRSRAEAEAAAWARLGTMDELARAMVEQRQFQSWCARAPWAMFGVGPLLFLAAAYFLACLYLWFGWRMFLPGADTPFGGRTYSMYDLAYLFFQTGKYYYICAPVLVGWGIGLLAARQRLKAVWPTVALLLIAWMGATAQIQASRTAVPAGLGHISMKFFMPGGEAQVFGGLVHALVIFSVAALPYVIWRLNQGHARSA
ncbi:MAG TPA: hypothetical protein VL155_13160 [Terriglobales bacterium]|nr:hypothetical protein [Terriglobales bacterium]